MTNDQFLTEHPAGNYQFLPGIQPYSCGVVACPGYEIVHVTFHQPVAYRAAFDRITDILSAEGRPQAALCGVELRSPRPFSFAGFAELNSEYAAILERWGVFVRGINPVARTNVAPVIHGPTETVLYGFSFTRPGNEETPRTFVVAGAGELPEGSLDREEIVALDDTTPSGMLSKSRLVMELMERRLQGLGCNWSEVTRVNVYTAHFCPSLITDVVLPRAETANRDGIVWHNSRPPVEEIEFEMDVRGIRTELRC